MSGLAVRAALRPFADNACPACSGNCPTLRYCEHICRPGIQGHGTDGFISGSNTYREDQERFPHLHKFCSACGYEFLSECRTSVAS